MPKLTQQERQAEYKRRRAEYLSRYPDCQYSQQLSGILGIYPRRGELCCVEHIFNRHGEHSEHWSNYASTTHMIHLWKHENDTAGRIAILAFKKRLAQQEGDERHYDLQALKRASGFVIPGWAEIKLEQGLPAWCRPFALELMAK